MTTSLYSFPVLVEGEVFYFKPNVDYLVRPPAFNEDNTQVSFGQTGAYILLTTRESHKKIQFSALYGESYDISGRIYESIELLKNPAGTVIYILEGVKNYNRTNRYISFWNGDSFSGEVAAATSKVTRTSVSTPNYGSLPVMLNYNLSVGSLYTGTSGDDFYIEIQNPAGTINYICYSGSMSGKVLFPSSDEFQIVYENADTVSHRMAASFFFTVL